MAEHVGQAVADFI